VLLGVRLAGLDHLDTNQLVAAGLKARNDLADQLALSAIGLDERNAK